MPRTEPIIHDPYAHMYTFAVLTGTDACAYPTPNGWVWASRPWCGWRFSIETFPTDPRYGSKWAGDTRPWHCFFCGEETDPAGTPFYLSPFEGVPPGNVHQSCLHAHRAGIDELSSQR